MTDLSPLIVVLAFLAGGAFAITLHELGHAAAAWVFRMPVRVFAIGGSRPPILCWRWGETSIEIRPWFSSGYVEPYPLLRQRPFALMALNLGGVAANLAACLLLSLLASRLQSWSVAAWSLLPEVSPALAQSGTMPLPEPLVGIPIPGPDRGALGHVLATLFATQLLAVIGNLWPHSIQFPNGERFRSDGLQVLDQLRGKSGADAEAAGEAYLQHLALLGMEAGPAALRSRVAPILHHWATAALPDRIARDEKRAALLRLLRRSRLTPAEKLQINAILATDVTLHVDQDLMEAAKTWTRDALQLSDWPSVRAIRGAVLAETGDPAGAVALLDPIVEEGGHPLYRFYRGMYLARALHRLGRQEEARDWFAWARPTDPAVWAINHVLTTRTATLLGLPPEDLMRRNLPPVPDSLFHATPSNDADPDPAR